MRTVETGEPLQLGNLPMVWHALTQLDEQVEQADGFSMTQMDFTDRHFDEAGRTGRRMWIHTHSYLGAARDNQLALEDMLRGGFVRTHAPWNFVRPAFEAAFYVVWLLAPDDGRERMRRGLRLAWAEHKAHTTRFKLMVKMAHAEGHGEVLKAEAKDRDVRRRYVEEAQVVGMSEKKLGEAVNITKELPKLTDVFDREPYEAEFHLLKWRELSGIQHADMGAMLRGSDTEYKLTIPGGSTATVTINDDAFTSACYSAAGMQVTAMNLYIQRSRKATRPGHI